MPLLPFGDYRPDVSDYEASTERNAQNVVPRGDGFGPFPSLLALSQSLGAQCRGAFSAFKPDGSVLIFAATATDLFVMNNTTFGWTKVSLGGGSYAAIATGDQWRFVQFNSLVIAVQANVVPQVFDVTTSTAFANLAGSPPQARYVDIVGQFVVLSGLLTNPNRIQWSGLGDVNGSSSWTPGVNSSDYQDLTDGGFVRGVAGGDWGVILQDGAIRTMTYLPGSPVIFQIQRVAQDKGIYGPYSLVRAGATIFFYSTQGFQRIDPSGLPVPIGRERIDRTFFADLDSNNLQLFIGIADPRSSRAMWAYKSINGASNQFDKVLCYDWVLDKFTIIKISGEYLLPVSQPGKTLESLDAVAPGGSIDAMTQSLDSFTTAVIPEIAAFDSSHILNFFRGPSLEAALETSEQGTDGRRLKLRGFRPITDAKAPQNAPPNTAALYGSASYRETQQATVNAGAEVAISPVTGKCDLIMDTRYTRMKCRIPAGMTWTFINGVEPDISQTGKR